MKLTYKVALGLILGFILVLGISVGWIDSSVNSTTVSAKDQVANVTDSLLSSVAQDTAKRITVELTGVLSSYIENRNITNIQELANDPFARKMVSTKWYQQEYSFVVGIEGDTVIIILHPNSALILKTPEEIGINENNPKLYSLFRKTVRAKPGEFVSGWYAWEGKKKWGVFYVTNIVLKDKRTGNDVRLAVGTGLYADSYLKDVLKLSKDQDPSDKVVAVLNNLKSAIKAATTTALLLAALIIVIFVYLANKIIATPIVQLAGVSDKIAEGEVEVKVPYQDRDDEIGILAKAIEKVRRSLEIAIKTLEEFT